MYKKVAILALAALVGVVSILPHFLAVQALGSDYHGYPFIYQANEDLYMARVQTILDGHPLVGSLMYEYQDTWPPVAPVPEQFYALPSLALHIPLATTIVFYKFLLPALLFLLIYALTRTILGREHPHSRLCAIAAALFITLGYDLVNYQALLSMLRGTLEGTILSVWTRPINPISGALFLFSTLIVVAKIVTSETRHVWIAGALALGLSIGYVFSWSLGVVVTGLALLWMLYQRDMPRALRLFGMLILSIVLQLPHWYHVFLSFGANGNTHTAEQIGAAHTHALIINKFLLLGIIAYGALVLFERYKTRQWRLDRVTIMCGGLLLACLIVFNQQIITGITVWPYHYVQYTIPLIAIAILVFATHLLASRFPRAWSATLYTLCIASIGVSLLTSTTYMHTMNDFRARQAYMPVFAWFEERAPKDCVVLVDEDSENVTMLIGAFTHCHGYINSYIPFSVPDERIIHNVLVLLRLQHVQPNDVDSYLHAHPLVVNTYLYNSIDQSLSSGLNTETEANIVRLEQAYPQFYKNNFAIELKKYKIDYILTDTAHPLPADLSVEMITTISAWKIYRLK